MRKYFSIIKNFEIAGKGYTEQIEELIAKDLYIEGVGIYPIDNLHEYHFKVGFVSTYPRYLGKDLIYNDKEYTLNPIFLDDVFEEWKSCMEEKVKQVNEDIESTKVKLSIASPSMINKFQQNFQEQYSEKLSTKLFRQLHLSEFSISKENEALRKFLNFCWWDLSSYIFGDRKVEDFEISEIYLSYRELSMTLDLFNDIVIEEKLSDGAFTSPMRIALFNELGVFDLPIFKNVSKKSQQKLVAALLGLRFENRDVLRAMQGHLNILFDLNSGEDPRKYTAYTHSQQMHKFLESLK